MGAIIGKKKILLIVQKNLDRKYIPKTNGYFKFEILIMKTLLNIRNLCDWTHHVQSINQFYSDALLKKVNNFFAKFKNFLNRLNHDLWDWKDCFDFDVDYYMYKSMYENMCKITIPLGCIIYFDNFNKGGIS